MDLPNLAYGQPVIFLLGVPSLRCNMLYNVKSLVHRLIEMISD
jgi:hypothetical protein